MRPAPAQTVPAPLLAIACGLLLWGVGALLIHRREPWDSGLYWVLIYPLGMVVSARLAWHHPQRPGLLALLVFESQYLGQMLRNGEPGNLRPLGRGLFALVALPAVVAARLAAARSPSREAE